MKQLNPVLMQKVSSFKSSADLSPSQRSRYDLLHHRPTYTNICNNSLKRLGASDMKWTPELSEVCSKYTFFKETDKNNRT